MSSRFNSNRVVLQKLFFFFSFCLTHTAKASGKHRVNVVKTVYHRMTQIGKDLRRSSGPFGGKDNLDEIT